MSGITASLNDTDKKIDASNDSIIIVSCLETVPGGRTLDVTGFTDEVINEGHIVIEEDATGNCKPMPVTNGAYAALPAGHTIKGVVNASALTKRPFVGIVVRGSVNKVASKYPVTTTIEQALPLIRFVKD